MADSHPPPPTATQAAFAWAVHGVTALGTVIALMALTAVIAGDYRLALLWLLGGLALDGIDGTLARKAHVKTRAARIDGDTLDLIIDYLTYVFVPAVLIVRAGFLPEAAALWLGGLILVSALYNFTRRDLKTEDNYFRGFPALWNVVAFYFFVTQPGPALAAGLVIALAALTFAPVHFVHPFRVTRHGAWLPALAIVWAAATAALLWPGWSEGIRTALVALSVGTAAVLFALGLLRTFQGPRGAAPEGPVAR